MQVRFLVASEHHARQYAALKLPGIIYTDGARRPTIETILAKADVLEKTTFHPLTSLFTDVLNEASKDIVFVITLHLGSSTHPALKQLPEYTKYISTPLELIPGTVVLSNELLLYPVPEYICHAHGVVTRTPTEYKLVRESFNPVYLTGDLTLDPWCPIARTYNGNVLLLTSMDPSRYKAASEPISQIIADLEQFHSDQKINVLKLKEHPGTCDRSYEDRIIAFCNKNRITLEKISSRVDIGTLSDSVAFVHSSFSSHLQLRRLGVESYYYYSPNEANWDAKFLELSKHPNYKYSVKGMNREQYDEYLRVLFQLDGHVRERFIHALKQIHSLRYSS